MNVNFGNAASHLRLIVTSDEQLLLLGRTLYYIGSVFTINLSALPHLLQGIGGSSWTEKLGVGSNCRKRGRSTKIGMHTHVQQKCILLVHRIQLTCGHERQYRNPENKQTNLADLRMHSMITSAEETLNCEWTVSVTIHHNWDLGVTSGSLWL